MTNTDFDLVKAKQLLDTYIKNHNNSKRRFLVELISFQTFFGSTSILNYNLSLCGYYQKKTVNSVLSDLGYHLTYYKNVSNRDLCGVIQNRSSNISFTVAEGN